MKLQFFKGITLFLIDFFIKKAVQPVAGQLLNLQKEEV